MPGASTAPASSRRAGSRSITALPDGTFEDVTDRAGVGGDGAWGTGAFVADVDGDGWPDLFVTCFGRNILYRNQGNGTFANIARGAGLESPGWNTGAAFFDADGDGDLDVYVAAYIAQSIDDVLNAKRTLPWKGVEMVANGPFGMTGAPDHFFRNDGHGHFTDATDEAGFTDKALGFGFAVRAADLDGDGLVDVYVANDSDPNYLYRNEGKGHFKEVATWAGCALDEKGASQASMGIALGDVNGDGVLDVFVTNFSEDFATLYAGGPGGIFEDVSRATGIGPMTYKPLKWGTALRRPRQRRRSRRRRRQRPHLPAGRSASRVHRHVRAAELRRREPRQGSAAVSRRERDGRSRIRGGGGLPRPRGRGLRQRRRPRPAVHAAGRPARAAPERQPGVRGVADRYSGGVRGEPAQIGTTVTIRAGGRIQWRDVASGDSYLSTHDPRPHFGLGPVEIVDEVDVKWPDGTHTVKRQVKARQMLHVRQGQLSRKTSGRSALV